MRRRITFALTALALAMAAVLPVTPAASVLATPAAACGWVQESGSYHQSSREFVSLYFNDYDTLYADILTEINTCNNQRYYRVSEWTQRGTPLSYSTEVSVWVCGVYKGYSINGFSVVYSPTYSYGGCGRQASSAGSTYAYGSYSANGTIYPPSLVEP